MSSRRAPARRSRRPLPRSPSAWWWFGGLGGAFFVATSAHGVPQIGVALVSVCLVAGTTTGALLSDEFGLGPSGRPPRRSGGSRAGEFSWHSLPGAPWLYLGGPLGLIYILIGASMVRVLGVLRLVLGVVAGQLIAAVAIDAAWPEPGTTLRVTTVIGAIVTVIGVWVSGRDSGDAPAAAEARETVSS